MSAKWTPTAEEAAEDAAILAEVVSAMDASSAAVRSAGVVLAEEAMAVATAMGCKPWLLAEVRERAGSANPLDRVAAAGMVLRYAYSALQAPAAMFEALVAGRAEALNALAPIQALARAMTELEVDVVRCAALDDAGDLHDDFPSIQRTMALGEDHEAASYAMLVRTSRDDLESVAVVLDLVGASESLRGMLENVDQGASTHLTMFDMLYDDDLEDEQLSAASVVSPDRWWTSLS